jgi:hypothetical protein
VNSPLSNAAKRAEVGGASNHGIALCKPVPNRYYRINVSDRRERRYSGRYNLGFGISYYREAGDAKYEGICYDVSTTGMTIGTKEKLMVGEHVHIRFRLMPEHANEASVSASPIRVMENPYDTTDTWPYLSAIQFDDPFPELEPMLNIASQARKPRG